MLIHSSETYIQEVLLAKPPAISSEICAEVKLRGLARYRTSGLLPLVHLKLGFLRHYRCLTLWFRAGETHNRAEMSAGAHHQLRSDASVRDPLRTGSFQTG